MYLRICKWSWMDYIFHVYTDNRRLASKQYVTVMCSKCGKKTREEEHSLFVAKYAYIWTKSVQNLRTYFAMAIVTAVDLT